jgi:hypothetical protein
MPLPGIITGRFWGLWLSAKIETILIESIWLLGHQYGCMLDGCKSGEECGVQANIYIQTILYGESAR